jgi:hypothetical protein
MTWLSVNTTGIINIITSPTVFFPALKQNPTFMFPLMMVLVAGVATFLYYFATVDLAWLTSQLDPSNGTAKEAEQAQPYASFRLLAMASFSGVLIGTPLALLLYAAYFSLVDKVINDSSNGFKSWLSLVCWCSIPVLFISISSCINISLVDNGRMALNAINPLTLNNLFFHLSLGDDFFGPLNSLDLAALWVLLLMVVGFHQWTHASLSKSIAIVITPTVIKYIAWVLLIVA